MSWSTKEKTLELFCFIFVEVIKKVYGFCFFRGGDHPVYIYIYIYTKGFHAMAKHELGNQMINCK